MKLHCTTKIMGGKMRSGMYKLSKNTFEDTSEMVVKMKTTSLIRNLHIKTHTFKETSRKNLFQFCVADPFSLGAADRLRDLDFDFLSPLRERLRLAESERERDLERERLRERERDALLERLRRSRERLRERERDLKI